MSPVSPAKHSDTYGSLCRPSVCRLCCLRSIVTHRDHFVRRPSICLSVRPSVCLSVCQTRIAMYRRRHMHSSECCHYFLLAHPSRRLEWAIVIARCLSSVRPLTFHIFDFFSRTAWWILMKLGRDEILMVPYKCCYFRPDLPRGGSRAGQK